MTANRTALRLTRANRTALIALADAVAGPIAGMDERALTHLTSVGDPAGIVLAAAARQAMREHEESVARALDWVVELATRIEVNRHPGGCGCTFWMHYSLNDACRDLLALLGEHTVRDLAQVAA